MTSVLLSPRRIDRSRLEKLSDGLAVAMIVVLPWSTTGAAVFLVLWLLSLIPISDFPGLRRILRTPAGALPVALVALAAMGTLWADVSWIERLQGINAFLKLLVIPLLMMRFSSSDRGHWMLNGLLVSVTLLLVVTTVHFVWPTMPVLGKVDSPGVPIHDYIVQSSLFTFAIFVILEMAAQAWKERRLIASAAMLLLASAFLANIISIATGRTTFVVIPILLALFCLRQATLKGTLVIGIVAVALAGMGYTASPYLQKRVASIYDEVFRYRTTNEFTSAGFRLEFWKHGMHMLAEAPIVGHGTGSIREMYRRVIERGESTLPAPTPNPHNQMLGIGIQLGAIGILLVVAMWIAHVTHFFRRTSLAGWAGLVIVAQNVVSCLFVSYLFDFAMGWTYAIMVGALAGTVMQEKQTWSHQARANTGSNDALSRE